MTTCANCGHVDGVHSMDGATCTHSEIDEHESAHFGDGRSVNVWRVPVSCKCPKFEPDEAILGVRKS